MLQKRNVIEIAKTGSDLTYIFEADTLIPYSVTHFFVFTRNDDGEMSTGVSGDIIDTDTNSNSLIAADIDNDGDMDIIVGGNSHITWFENDGYNTFDKHSYGGGQYVESVYTTDLDDDGFLDILGAANNSGTIYWIEIY